MNVDMSLKIIHPCIGESVDGKTQTPIPVGETVEYRGHVPIGMLLVRWNDSEYVVHPNATDIDKD